MWKNINDGLPPANKNIQVFLKNGKVLNAQVKLIGTSLQFKPLNEKAQVFSEKDILYWSEILESAPPRKPCRKCGRR